MTAETQPTGRIDAALEHLISGIAWTMQAAAATTYLIVTTRSSLWQPILGTNPVGAICTWGFAACMAALWGISLWSEHQRFYDRLIQRSSRRAGLVSHLSVLFIAALSASGSPHRIAWWIILGLMCFCAVATWGSWMQTRFLPDEDQAIIDAIISRETAQRAAVHRARELLKRRERLSPIVQSLGYTLTDAPAQAAMPAEPPAVQWAIPQGKHAPLVYFIRNGNRMKIGTTTELKRRIRTLALREANVALLVNGDQRRERAYHKQFTEHRIGNTEWFAYEGTLADYVHEQITQKGGQQ